MLAVSDPARDYREEERDARAAALAAKWWPSKYVGDLTTAQWARVYEAVDAAGWGPTGSEQEDGE